MPVLRFPAAVLLPLFFGCVLRAADTPPVTTAPGSEEVAGPQSHSEEIARLNALPPSHIPLKGATLASAIRFLCQSAGMSYLSPPESDFSERVTTDVRMNPFALLQVLAENYNFAFDYRSGVWQFYRINLNELVSKSYLLRFNNLEQVSITSSSINSQLAAMGSMTSNSSSGGSSGGPSGSSPSYSASAAGKGSFSSKTDKIIDDIKKILGVPTVGLATLSLEGSPTVPGIDASRKPMDAPRIEPIWNPDTSQLFVIATRQQHSLIAAYLKTIDRPQKLIRIAVKFVETARNPQQSLGVDWSQTFLGSGGPITLSGATSITTNTMHSNAGTTASIASNGQNSSSSSSSSGNGGGSSGGSSSSGGNALSTALSSAINLNHPGNIALPISLLSAPAFQWTVQAIASDRFSSIVQDPVIYTSNNREVSFKATSQQPIQEGTTTIGSATAATTSQIAYIDVGTEVTILPCILPGSGHNKELVQLNLSINVSSITGEQTINGNQYPVTSSRTYSYSVAIPNGETLAIAGLEERSRQTTDSKIPIFGDIPVIGYAFKNKSNAVVHTTLLAFITPDLIRTDSGEDAGPAPLLPEFKHRVFQGSKDETLAEVDQSLKGLPEDIAALQAVATAVNKDEILNRLDLIGVELSLIDVRLGELSLNQDRITVLETARAEAARRRLDQARYSVDKIRSGVGS